MASHGRTEWEGGTRIMGLPVSHWLVAAGIGLAFMMVGAVWSAYLPSQVYVGSSLLFFDRAAAVNLMPPEMGQSRGDAKAFADSIISDEMVDVIISQFGLFSGSKQTAMVQFRSNLSLSDESTSSLRITWRGSDRGQTVAVTNAIAVLLTSGTPKFTRIPQESAANPPSPPKTPASPIVQTPAEQAASAPTDFLRQVMHDVQSLKREQARRSAEFVTLDRRLATLGDESRRLQSRIHMEEAKQQAAVAIRQPLAAQLAAEKKRLDNLRLRYTDTYPDVEAARERVAEIEKKLNTISVEHAAPNSDQSRLEAVTEEIKHLDEEKARLLSVEASAGQAQTDLPRGESGPGEERCSRRVGRTGTTSIDNGRVRAAFRTDGPRRDFEGAGGRTCPGVQGA